MISLLKNVDVDFPLTNVDFLARTNRDSSGRVADLSADRSICRSGAAAR